MLIWLVDGLVPIENWDCLLVSEFSNRMGGYRPPVDYFGTIYDLMIAGF